MLKKEAGFDIDELINAIGLPTTNLDDLAKRLDDLGKNVEDNFDKIKKEFNLDDNVTLNELKKAIDELENFKNKSIHDSYHNKYNKAIKEKMIAFGKKYNAMLERRSE